MNFDEFDSMRRAELMEILTAENKELKETVDELEQFISDCNYSTQLWYERTHGYLKKEDK